jgi:hypothetical protein
MAMYEENFMRKEIPIELRAILPMYLFQGFDGLYSVML